MLGGADVVKIHGEFIPLRASVEMLTGLSGHADYLELTRWLKASNLKASTKVKLIHGEPEALESLRVHLLENTIFDVSVAAYRDTLYL